MNADTNTATNKAMRMRFPDRVTKTLLNPTVPKFTAGMHEGEHAGYDDGFRAGSRQNHHRHHGFRIIIGG